MKKFILTICMISAFMFTSQAQIDLKINPIGLLFGSPDLSGEYVVNENIGVELSAGILFGKVIGSGIFGGEGLDKSGYRIRASGKYYFSPDDGADGFFAGLYLGPRSRPTTGEPVDTGNGTSYEPGAKTSAFSLGVLIGYKWVSEKGIIFEIDGGLGRGLGNKITLNDLDNPTEVRGLGLDGVLVMSVGYRFGER